MVRIGELVVIIDALIGDVRLNPNIKDPWLNTIPNREAKKSSSRSLDATCSGLVKTDASQNKQAAPNIRQSVSNNGVTALANTSFETGAISPHITSAPHMAPCPFHSFFVISRFLAMPFAGR